MWLALSDDEAHAEDRYLLVLPVKVSRRECVRKVPSTYYDSSWNANGQSKGPHISECESLNDDIPSPTEHVSLKDGTTMTC